jgi:type I restriction enzyme S subunit
VSAVVARSTGISYPAINPSELGSLPFPRIAGAGQRLTADTPDRATAAIDDLIAKKQPLIDLLEEKRAALISLAVTRGLDPSAPMKDSGVEWLGRVPKHWSEWRMSEVVQFVSGSTPSVDRLEFWDGSVP